MIDRGSGVPVVLVPGIQGRWEWMAPTVDALAERCRVLTFSLCDEPTSGFEFDSSLGLDAYVDQIAEALDRAEVESATLIGVSYGGLIVTEFARRHPARVTGLVLVSALPPGWTPNKRARFYMRAPRLLSPLFCASSPLRLWPEVSAAFPPVGARLRFMTTHGWRVVNAFLSPARMAQRARWAEEFRFGDARDVRAPALVVTGEDALDLVVPPSLTRRYLDCLPGARHVVLPQTGHIGLVTRPAAFADIIDRFLREIPAHGRRVPA